MEQGPQLRIGVTLGRAARVYARLLPGLLLVSGVLYLPLVLVWIRWSAWSWDGGTSVAAAWWFFALYQGLSSLIPFLVQVFVAPAVFRQLGHAPARMTASIGSGLRVVVPTLGLAFLLLLVTAAVRIGLFVVAAMLDATTGSAALDAILHTGAYIVLGGWIASMWFVAPQALVVERLGPVRALGRSVRLTAGSRWRVFGLYVLLVFAYLLAAWLLGLVFQDAASWGSLEAWMWCSGLLMALTAAFGAVCATVVYHDLRRAKEGVDLGDLMRVFE